MSTKYIHRIMNLVKNLAYYKNKYLLSGFIPNRSNITLFKLNEELQSQSNFFLFFANFTQIFSLCYPRSQIFHFVASKGQMNM